MGVLDITDYGAVGDGQANDTAAIQSAIDSAGPGDVVRVPAGRYAVGAAHVGLQLRGRPLTLEGEGESSVILGAYPGDGNAPGASILSGRAADLVVAGLALEPGPAGGYQRGLWCRAGSARVTVRDVTMRRPGMGPERTTPVAGVWCDGPVDGLDVDGLDVLEVGGSHHDSAGLMVYIGAAPSTDLRAKRLRVTGRAGDLPACGVVLFNPVGAWLTEVVAEAIGHRPGFEGQSGYGIAVYAAQAGWASDVDLERCRVEGTDGSGIYLAGVRCGRVRWCDVREAARLQDGGSLCVGGISLVGDGQVEGCDVRGVGGGDQPNRPACIVVQAPWGGPLAVVGCTGVGHADPARRGAGLQIRGPADGISHAANAFRDVRAVLEQR